MEKHVYHPPSHHPTGNVKMMLDCTWERFMRDVAEMVRTQWAPDLILPAQAQVVQPVLCGIKVTGLLLEVWCRPGKEECEQWMEHTGDVGMEASVGWMQAGGGGHRECTFWVVIVEWQAGDKNVCKSREEEALAL